MPVVGPRFPHARLQRPQVVFAPPPPTQTQQTIRVSTVRTRPRHTNSDLPGPPGGARFVAPPASVNCLQPDRLARRHRRRPPPPSLGDALYLKPLAVITTPGQLQ